LGVEPGAGRLADYRDLHVQGRFLSGPTRLTRAQPAPVGPVRVAKLTDVAVTAAPPKYGRGGRGRQHLCDPAHPPAELLFGPRQRRLLRGDRYESVGVTHLSSARNDPTTAPPQDGVGSDWFLVLRLLLTGLEVRNDRFPTVRSDQVNKAAERESRVNQRQLTQRTTLAQQGREGEPRAVGEAPA
jgi:hypothetical protein